MTLVDCCKGNELPLHAINIYLEIMFCPMSKLLQIEFKICYAQHQ